MIFVRHKNRTITLHEMNNKTISILTALKNLKKPNPEQKYIDGIVNASYQIAHTYLCEVYKNINAKILLGELRIVDLAIESIQPLLFMNEDGYLFTFNNIIEKNELFPQSEEDAIYFLYKIVGQQVEDRISLLLKENDLSFSKIKNWVELLAKRESYKKLSYFGNGYFVDKEVKQISGLVLSENDFNLLPVELFNNKDEILKAIFNYLKDEDKFFPAIPINTLVQHLKNLYVNDNSVEKNLKEVSKTINSNFHDENKIEWKRTRV